MAHIRITWRASRLIPCPICNGDHTCSAADNDMHFCWRVHWDVPPAHGRTGWVWLGDTRNGWGMFVDTGYTDAVEQFRPGANWPRAAPTSTRQRPVSQQDYLTTEELSAYLRGFLAHADRRIEASHRLGVSAESLLRLRIGWVPESDTDAEHWLFPERDGQGRIIGLLRRYPSGEKRQYPGSRRGLVYDPDGLNWNVYVPGRLALIVEGPSDVAAADTIGCLAIGRPSNLGGSDYLAVLLRRHVERDWVVPVVLGENDQKESGLWPGREGAVRVAQDLANAWGRPVAMAMPPRHAKDFRAWMLSEREIVSGRAVFGDLNGMRNRMEGWIRDRMEWVQPVPGNASTYVDPRCVPTFDILREEQEGGMGETDSVEDGAHHIGESRNASVCTSVDALPDGEWEEDTSAGAVGFHGGCPIAPEDHPPGSLCCQDELSLAVLEVIEDGLLRTPCPKHSTPLLQSRDNPHRAMVIRADCWRFKCDICRPKKAARWLLHLMCLLDGVGLRTDGQGLHLWQGPAGKPLQAVLRRLRGRKAGRRQVAKDQQPTNYATVQTIENQITLVMASPIASTPTCPIVPVTPAQAADHLARALQCVNRTIRRPVTTSYDWRLVEPMQQGNYDRRGSARKGHYRQVVESLERRNMNPRTRDMTHGQRADWTFPEQWAEEEVALCFEWLRGVGWMRG